MISIFFCISYHGCGCVGPILLRFTTSEEVSIAILLIFGLSNSNADYTNCMKATKHNYITKEGIDHISAQCKAFVKEKVMVK